jgi:hypothetical protein
MTHFRITMSGSEHVPVLLESIEKWVLFFSWTFSYSVSCEAPRLHVLFTLVLHSSMVLPVPRRLFYTALQ